MFTMTSKYLPAKENRGARVRAYTTGNVHVSATKPYNPGRDDYENHAAAALECMTEFVTRQFGHEFLVREVHSGQTRNGDWVWLFNVGVK